MLSEINSAHFQLTVRCNLNCSFCGQSRGMAGCASGEFSADEWLAFAAQLREISKNVPDITLWGGEPMLYSDFNILAEKLFSLGHKLNIVTNATLIENSTDVLNNCFDKIFISLDGMKSEHDAVRGKGVFDRVAENIKALKNRKGKLVFLCTVSDANVEKIPELLPQMAELGCDEIVLQQLMYLTEEEIADYRRYSLEHFGTDYPELVNWQRNNDENYRNKLTEMLARIKEEKYKVPVVFTGHAYWFSPESKPCQKSEERVHIRHDGEVGFCTDYFGFSAGNVRELSLKEIFFGERAGKFRKAVEEHKLAICRHCPWKLQQN